MATPASIGIIIGKALDQLEANAAAVSAKLDVPTIEIPKLNRDRDLLRARQLEAVSIWVEALAASLGVAVPYKTPEDIVAKNIRPAGETVVPDEEAEESGDGLQELTIPALIALAAEQGIDLDGASRKSEIVDRIRASISLDIHKMTVKQLRQVAEEEKIDLEGITLKANILARIEEARQQ